MSAAVYRQNFVALLPNQSVHIFGLNLLLLFMFFVGVQDGRAVPGIFFPSAAILYFSLITGSRLTEFFIKPVSFCLPRQQHALGVMLIVYGLFYCLLCSLVFMIFPRNGMPESLAFYVSYFFLGVTFFLVISVALVFSTSIAVIVLPVSALLLVMVSPDLAATTAGVFYHLGAQPLLCFFVLALSAVMTVRLCTNKALKRKLCAKPYVSFTASTSPAKVANINRLIKREKLQKTYASQVHAGPDTIAPYLKSHFTGTDLRLFLNDLYLFGHQVDLKALILTVAFLVVYLAGTATDSNPFGRGSVIVLSVMSLLVVLGQFQMFFLKNCSPMLSTSRATHFRQALFKGAFLYLLAVAIVLAEFLLLGVIRGFTSNAELAQVPPLPLKVIFIFAMISPLLAWMHITLRSAFSQVPFALMMFIGSSLLIFYYLDYFAEWPVSFIALLTVLLWLPYVGKSYVDCFKRDLITDKS